MAKHQKFNKISLSPWLNNKYNVSPINIEGKFTYMVDLYYTM
jgi:hypothetical protein